MQKNRDKQQAAKRQCEIITDLPLSCPQQNDLVWNAHPRVYLPLENRHSGLSYCNTKYILKDFTLVILTNLSG